MQNGLTIEQRIERCDVEIAKCFSSYNDGSLSKIDKYFATMGEADWTVEKLRLEREALGTLGA